MLQEILLCLAGHSSPLLRQSQSRDAVDIPTKPDERVPLLSPPERALLSTVAHLSELHIKIKNHAASISTSHPSTICKAVASAITTQQLERFMNKIVEVERLILLKDAGYVGGYGIVPLSAVVGEFAPWTRRLEWLWEVVVFMQPSLTAQSRTSTEYCTGSEVMKFLRRESHTGYYDLEETALELIKVAEKVWLRQLSTWVLYGKLPNFGHEDFFVQPRAVNKDAASPSLPEFSVRTDLVPEFVTTATASSILFIGQSLNQVRERDQTLAAKSFSEDPAMRLLPAHLELLKTIESPISSFIFTNVLVSIRLSMSQNFLSQLLPLPKVFEILRVLQQFLLLGRGEFAASLISNADKRIANRHYGREAVLPTRKAGRLDNLAVKDVDLSTVLVHTWSELVALQKGDDIIDDILEKGQEMLRIIPQSTATVAGDRPTDFSGLLFPTPTSLTLSIPPSSSLALFLTQEDISSYSEINSYLVGIRRAQMHLASLWKNSNLRRLHSSPLGPDFRTNTTAGLRRLAERRKRENARNDKMRRHWAVASKSQFVLSELGGYFQGEMIEGHWQHFLTWLLSLRGEDEISSVNASSSGIGLSPNQLRNSQRSAASSDFRRSALDRQPKASDPATLTKAHQRYLRALQASLLLNATDFTKVLLDVLRLVDHFVALFARLQTTQQHIDLEIDEGVVDALANHTRDEYQILQEMEHSRQTIEHRLDELLQQLRQSVDLGDGAWDNAEGDWGISTYIPWKPRNIDGLLMKLEFIGAKAQSEATNDEEDDEIFYSE